MNPRGNVTGPRGLAREALELIERGQVTDCNRIAVVLEARNGHAVNQALRWAVSRGWTERNGDSYTITSGGRDALTHSPIYDRNRARSCS